MGQTSNQIEQYIEQQRDELGANVTELQQRVKTAFDWRAQFQHHPMTMVGIAFGGGVLLATLTGRRDGGRWASDQWSASSRGLGSASGVSSLSDQQKRKAWETWDNMKGAVLGLAAARFKDFLGDMVPGFNEHYRKTEREKASEQSPPRFSAGSAHATGTGG